MKNKITVKMMIFSFACLIFLCLSQNSTLTNTTQTSVPSWLKSSTNQYTNFLQDKYNYFITTNGNRVWVATMNLAWNQMKRNFLLGQNATFFNTTELQQHIVDNLNNQVFTSDQLTSDAYYVYSGYGQQSIDKINFDVREKFPLRTLPELTEKLIKQDFISFSYLFKNFKFLIPFTPLPGYLFKGKAVDGFTATSTKQKKQLYYKYYNSSNDFMIGIDTLNGNDEVILWKTNVDGVNSFGINKLLKMFEMFYNLPSNKLASIDQFKMPVVNLDLTRSYNDMIDLQFSNVNKQRYKIKKMNDKIKLRITRFGVELQAEGQVQLMLTSSRFSKYFYLSSDFWVILKEKNKHPYLVSLITSSNQFWSE